MYSSQDIERQRKRTIDLLITQLERYHLNKDGRVSLQKVEKGTEREGKDQDKDKDKNAKEASNDEKTKEITVDEAVLCFKKQLIKDVEAILFPLMSEPNGFASISASVTYIVSQIVDRESYEALLARMKRYANGMSTIDLRFFIQDLKGEAIPDNGTSMEVMLTHFEALLSYKVELKFALMDARENILHRALANSE